MNTITRANRKIERMVDGTATLLWVSLFATMSILALSLLITVTVIRVFT